MLPRRRKLTSPAMETWRLISGVPLREDETDALRRRGVRSGCTAETSTGGVGWARRAAAAAAAESWFVDGWRELMNAAAAACVALGFAVDTLRTLLGLRRDMVSVAPDDSADGRAQLHGRNKQVSLDVCHVLGPSPGTGRPSDMVSRARGQTRHGERDYDDIQVVEEVAASESLSLRATY